MERNIFSLSVSNMTDEEYAILKEVLGECKTYSATLKILPDPKSKDRNVITSTQFNGLADMVHQNAVEHGWWEQKPKFGELMALVHSEVSEALEHARNGREPDEQFYECGYLGDCGARMINDFSKCPTCEYVGKPDGIPIELADIIIRVLDICGQYHIDIGSAIFEKMAYNQGRPYKHGNKKF